MRTLVFVLVCFCWACQSPTTESDSTIEQQSIEKIDFHTHYRVPQTYLMEILDEWKMQAVLIDVVRNDSTGEHRYWPDILKHQQAFPNSFFMCSGFNAYGIDEPDFADRIISQIAAEVKAGARMVKVWKNIGMVDKDASGAFVQINDPRFQPIWDYLIANDIPVLAHIAEPIQAWLPLKESDQNPHFNYYTEHPQYHAYQLPEIPRYETIIAARDNWLANNPDLVVVGAHMGSMSHDVGMIAAHLDQYPNFYVEPAARFGDLVGQDSDKVRQFFIDYQDRILYGTDLGTRDGDEAAQAANQHMIKRMVELHWQYVSGTDSLYYDSPMISFPLSTHSLALPQSVLEKFYRTNAEKVLNLSP